MVVGIDEVGRGAWAGPLVAGAVALESRIEGLNDSKLLTKAQRESLAVLINSKACDTGLGWVSTAEIDEIGLTRAVSLAMERAIEQISIDYDEIIIDGNYNFLENYQSRERSNSSQQISGQEDVKGLTTHKWREVEVQTVVRADQTVPAVSAASIIAKVARDHYMVKMATKYPKYGFEKHVGYGTSLHLDSLKKQGVCGLHRKSYLPIKKIMGTAS